MSRWFAAAVAVLALGCAKDGARAPASSSAAAPAAQHAPAEVEPEVHVAAQHANMDEQYRRALEMRRAAVEGDLGRFTRAAIYIAENDIGPSAPEPWKPYAKALQQAAEQGRHAKSIEAAAAAVGQLGARCADCHRALGGPKFTLGEPPVQRAGVDAHMDRHQWAADRMWDGLIASATPVWIKGAEVMADARLTAEQVAPETPDIDAIARRVHFQANAARLLPEQQWGKAYGEFIATCALCHEKTGVAGRAEKPAK